MTVRLSTIAALLLAGTISAADAHAMLDHASPAVGSTVAKAPSRLILTFTEPIEPAFSGATVRNAAGQRVATGARAGSGKTALEVSLKSLPPGTYKVNWHVLSVDTHKSKGRFSFTVGGR